MFDLEKEKKRIDEKLSEMTDEEFIDSLKRNGYREVKSSNHFGYKLNGSEIYSKKKLELNSNLVFYNLKKEVKREIA
ncbi:MAG: hypothetical protein ACQEQF_06140 [Bacillota bacterium]